MLHLERYAVALGHLSVPELARLTDSELSRLGLPLGAPPASAVGRVPAIRVYAWQSLHAPCALSGPRKKIQLNAGLMLAAAASQDTAPRRRWATRVSNFKLRALHAAAQHVAREAARSS